MRTIDGLPSLRTKRVFAAMTNAIAAGSKRAFRVVQFSVQSNHVHLLVESDGVMALGRGMQGLTVRLAKSVNRLTGRHGRVWRDRYHVRALATPREVRNALAYVLLNIRKHRPGTSGIDPCSSGPWFTGWRERFRLPPGTAPVARPRTWLLCVGWRRWGRLSLSEAPKSASLTPSVARGRARSCGAPTHHRRR